MLTCASSPGVWAVMPRRSSPSGSMRSFLLELLACPLTALLFGELNDSGCNGISKQSISYHIRSLTPIQTLGIYLQPTIDPKGRERVMELTSLWYEGCSGRGHGCKTVGVGASTAGAAWHKYRG